LQASYDNQAGMPESLGRLEETFELLKKQEAFCLELGTRRDLAYCLLKLGPSGARTV
jgi:hypothetical protein